MGFNEVRKQYFEAREQEWLKLRDYLTNNLDVYDAQIPKQKGFGCKKYTSQGMLNTPYDLTNWRWVEIKTDAITIFVSFQPFDEDVNSGNKHALFDRIGISWYKGKDDAQTISNNMIITDVELPLSEEKLERIHSVIQYILSNYESPKKLRWKIIAETINK